MLLALPDFARLAQAAVADRSLELVGIAEGDEAVAHRTGGDPDIALPRVEGRRLALEHQRLLAVILEPRP